MKKNILYSSLILILISQVFCVVYAQQNTAISDSIYSNILKEQRSIKIQLPNNYKPGSTDKYEVIFVTDGEWSMDPFSFVYGWAKGEDYVPPVIIVSIPNKRINKKNLRDRDFYPVYIPKDPLSGGANNFLSFIKNELIPYIDNKYPSNKTYSIYGHSAGGLFVLYALLTEPQLFESYYAIDPPFDWNNDYLIKMAAEKLNSITSDKVFWIAGTSHNTDIARLDSVLQLKAPKTLHWETVTYKNEKHNSVRLKAMYDGIKYVYTGYSSSPIIFNPVNGILLKDKPVPVYFDSFPDLRYTLDGTEPNRTSPQIDHKITINGPAQLVVKSFSVSGKYDKMDRGNFELGETLASIPKPGRINSGGLKYSYYEGSWERLPDFKKLNPVKTGIADSAFNVNQLPRKSDFACLLEGYFEIVTDGYYTFALASDDGSKLFLNNKLIIDNDGIHSDEIVKSFILPLEKGFYPIRVEYFQKDEGSSLQLFSLDPVRVESANIPYRFLYNKE